MGYRAQDDALRARVTQLESELAAARGEGLKSRREGASRFDKKLHRQAWVIAGFSIFATLVTLGCGALPIGIFMEQTGEAVSASALRGSSLPLGSRLHSRGTPRMSTFRYIEPPPDGVPDSPFDEPNLNRSFIFAFEEAPNALFVCGYGCPREVREAVLGYADQLARGGQPEVHPIELYFTLHSVGSEGQGSYLISAEDVRAHAAQIGAAPGQIRVAQLHRYEIEMVYVFAGFAFFAAMLMIGGWSSLLYHRRKGKQVVELATAADYPQRDPVLVALLGLFTGGIYYLYWNYITTASLRRITGRPDLMPGMDLLLTLVSFGLWRAWVDWRNAEALDEALARLGDGHKSKVFTLWALAPFCRITPFIIPWTLQKGYNELAEKGVTEAPP